jgi:hypothetical protein
MKYSAKKWNTVQKKKKYSANFIGLKSDWLKIWNNNNKDSQ